MMRGVGASVGIGMVACRCWDWDGCMQVLALGWLHAGCVAEESHKFLRIHIDVIRRVLLAAICDKIDKSAVVWHALPLQSNAHAPAAR